MQPAYSHFCTPFLASDQNEHKFYDNCNNIFSGAAIRHSENKNVMQLMLFESEFKAAVQETINGTAA